MPAVGENCRDTSSRSLTAAVRNTVARVDQPSALKCHSTVTDEIRAFPYVLKNSFVAAEFRRVGKNDVGVTAWSMQRSGTAAAMPQIWMPG